VNALVCNWLRSDAGAAAIAALVIVVGAAAVASAAAVVVAIPGSVFLIHAADESSEVARQQHQMQ